MEVTTSVINSEENNIRLFPVDTGMIVVIYLLVTLMQVAQDEFREPQGESRYAKG
jgi:hypothetical protein